MRILLSNDDGIFAPGLAAVHRALTTLGEVHVVAPESPQSAVAHGITLPGPIAVRRVHVPGAFHGHSVEGRPADCVKLAITELLDPPPDLVVSGINDGVNVGINVLYSGTVAAAAEGAVLGCPAVAVSLQRGPEQDFSRAAAIALPIIRQLLGHGLAPSQLININIPDLAPGPPLGIRVVPQATSAFEDKFARHAAPDGRDYYWLTGGDFQHVPGKVESDLDAIHDRFVAVTPLQFDLTQHALLEKLRQYELRMEN